MGATLGISMVIAVFLTVLLILKQLFWRPQLKNVEGKHVVVTGGSSGIGKSVAILAAKKGANVTIIARNVEKLEKVKNQLQHVCKNKETQVIQYLSLDVASDFETIEKSFGELEKTGGPIFMLVNCAGAAVCGKIEDTSVENLKFMWNLNFLGTFQCIKAVVPRMKKSKDGIIVLTGSLATLTGIFGMSGYSSTKFALRGLAESIKMELRPYNIFVTLALPPDTDTPGLAAEASSKPLETILISDSAGLFNPADVASQIFADALYGNFFSTVGFEGFLMTLLCTGMSSVCSIPQILLEVMLLGFCRLVGACYLLTFDNTIKNCMKKRDQNKKTE